MISKIRKIFPFIVVGLLAYYFIVKVDWPATIVVLARVSYITFSFAIIVNVLAAVGMSTLHYCFTANDFDRKSFVHVESINSKVLGCSTILPTAVVAAYKIAGFNKVFGSTAKSVAFFLVGKVSSLIVAATVVSVLVYVGISGLEDRFDQRGLQAGLLMVLVFVFVFLILVNIKGVRNRIVAPILDRLPLRFSQALRNGASVFGIRAWASGIATQAFAFVLSAGAGVILALSVSPTFPIEAVILGRAVTLVALLAPISVAGVGAREVSYLAILPLYSVSSSNTAALVLLLLLTQWGAGAGAFFYSMFLDRAIRRGSE